MTEPLTLATLIVTGLAVGSFLNVCIYRVPRGMSVAWPPSRCTSCGRTLRWFENVPVVGYLAVGGRCRTCGAGISIVYPAVEAATPLLFVLQYWRTGWEPLLAPRLVFTCAMVVLFVVDLQHRVLPNVITLSGIVVGFVSSWFLPPGWLDALSGIAIGGGGLLAIAEGYYRIRGEEGLGMGDVKMLAMIGAFLGWRLMLVTLLLATVMGSVVGLGLIALNRGDLKYALPLGSFLAIGALIATAVGEPLLAWYLGFY